MAQPLHMQFNIIRPRTMQIRPGELLGMLEEDGRFFLEDMIQELQKYPDPVPKYRYVYTRGLNAQVYQIQEGFWPRYDVLKNSWNIRRTITAQGGVSLSLINDAREPPERGPYGRYYAIWVQGDKQAAWHGWHGWTKASDVVERAELFSALRRTMNQYLRGL